MIKTPRVTIIVAVFNGEQVLERCINSVDEQTYKNKELIIIDGLSKDNTVNILKENSDKIDYWISEKDNGITNAWNKALKKSTGDWILFLGADDLLYNENSLEKMLEHCSRFSSYDLIYGKVALINEKLETRKIIGERWNHNKFKTSMHIPHQGAFHSRTLFADQCYDEKLKFTADYDLLLRKSKELKVKFIEEVVSKMQIGGVSQVYVKEVYKEWLDSQVKYKVSNKLHLVTHFYYKLLKYKLRVSINNYFGLFKL
ncbi:glycosyltransferase family 2 protein [Priestia megaterium]|uniref:glycosyltransferase family 2 protein n=1 Tax=Priestia megaterium TaxID=1404 RepID=UPI002877303C|nr:glycosyltransferase family 2 protein [Priestia megaterium]